MATRSGTNAFHGSAAYLLRNENLDANTFSNNAQGIQKREFRVNDVGGAIGGPIRRNSVFFFSSYHGLRNNQGLDDAGDRADGPGARRELQPVVHPRRERQPGAGSRLRSVQRRAGRFGSLSPGGSSQCHHRQSSPGGPAGCSRSIRCRTARRTTCSIRTTSKRATVQTVRRHSNNNRVDWRAGKHSIYASGGISYADDHRRPGPSGSRRSTAPPGCEERRQSILPDRGLHRAVALGRRRPSIRTVAHRHQGRSQATRKGSPNSMPSASGREPSAADGLPGSRAGASTPTASTAATAAAATGRRCRPARSAPSSKCSRTTASPAVVTKVARPLDAQGRHGVTATCCPTTPIPSRHPWRSRRRQPIPAATSTSST